MRFFVDLHYPEQVQTCGVNVFQTIRNAQQKHKEIIL